MKKLTLVITVLMVLSTITAFADTVPTINDEPMTIAQGYGTVFSQDGELYIPLRAYIESAGGTIIWDNTSRSAIAEYTSNNKDWKVIIPLVGDYYIRKDEFGEAKVTGRNFKVIDGRMHMSVADINIVFCTPYYKASNNFVIPDNYFKQVVTK